VWVNASPKAVTVLTLLRMVSCMIKTCHGLASRIKVDSPWTALEGKRRRRGRKYRAAKVRILKGAEDLEQVCANQDDAPGLEGPTKTRDGSRKMRREDLRHLRIAEARLHRALEEVR
jgi:hypothetical protein